ncbi:MAG: hypothetical protein V1784_04515, partial [bacterium]
YYPHLLYAEFAPGASSTMLDRVGAWYGMGENKCVIGFDVFNRNKGEYSGMPDIPTGNMALPFRLNARWARPFGGVTVGAALGLYHESYKEGKKSDGTSSSLEQKSTIIGLDLGLTALDNLLDAAVGFEMPSWTNKGADGKDITENDGSMMFRAAARYWYNYGEKTTLIPNFEVRMMKDGFTAADTTGMSASTTTFRVGVGHNWKPADGVLVLFDFGVRFSSTKYEWQMTGVKEKTDSWTDLPYWRCGWEGQVFKWIKVRAGAEKLWQNMKQEINPLEPEAGNTCTNMYFGGDFFFGPVCIQYLLDQDFVRRGPYFISGDPGGIFHRFSLFYKVPK